MLALGLVGAAAAELLFAARPALSGARAVHRAVRDLQSLASPEARATTRAHLTDALDQLDVAHRRVSSSRALSLGFVPGVGTQRRGLLDLVADERTGGQSALRLLDSLDALAAATQLHGGVVPVDALAALSGDARAVASGVTALERDAEGLWGPVGDARRRLNRDAASSARRLRDAADAVDTARTFLGGDGERRYFMAIQNNAEMRDQGMVLSYATVRLAAGRPVFERSGSVLDLPLSRAADTPVPPGTAEVFGFIQPTRLWQSVNATADFAWSGRAMADMYRQASGQSVQGVIALDVPALAGLLRVVGPVSIEGVAEPITATNVGRLLLNDFYQGLGPTSDQTLRRERQGEVVKAIIDRLTSGARDAVTLGRELGDAARGGHLRLWSADAAEEDVFERTGLGGGPATKDADRTFHVAVQNRTASKLDYFVRPAVSQDVRLTREGTAVVRTTVAIENLAPPTARASYQFGPAAITEKPGDYLAWVLLWAPAGSMPLQSGVAESGLSLSQFVVAVPAGEKREVVFETIVPRAVRDGRLNLRLVPQPRLEPMPLSVSLRADGRSVDGTPTPWQGTWDRVHNLTWTVRP